MQPPAGAKIVHLLCGHLAAVFLCGCGPSHGDTTIRLASFSPSQGWTVQKVLKPWVVELNESFAGAASVELFSGGSLGRHADAQLQMVFEGIVDIAYILPSYTPGVFPNNDLFEMPLSFPDARAASLASWRMLKRGELRGYSGLKVLALYTTNPYYLHLRSPIHSIADLRGKKIRVTGGSLQPTVVAALGAIPIGGIAASELTDSIDRGLLDGTLLSWDLMHIYGVTQVTSAHIEFPLGFSALMIAMNPQKYASLPEPVRRAFDAQSGEKLIGRLVEANEELAQIGHQAAVRAGGHEFIVLSAQDELEWRSRLYPLIEARKSRILQTQAQSRNAHEMLADAPARATSIGNASLRN